MHQCYECGKELRDSYAAGICPACLLADSPLADVSKSPARSRSTAPPERLMLESVPICENYGERYEFLDDTPVSSGGQGLLFRVRDRQLRRTVALKRLSDSAASIHSAESRFLAEAQLTSQLHHPGFLPIFDLGLDPEGRIFFTTVLLPGRTFGDLIREFHAPHSPHRPSLGELLAVLLQICQIMAYAHFRKIVHRDLKPANILIGEFNEIYVIDLGSACVLPASANSAALNLHPTLDAPSLETDRTEILTLNPESPLSTSVAGMPGTLVYIPPEIFASPTANVGPPTDIYAMGVILYEILSGKLPYSLPDGSLPPANEFPGIVLRRPPTPPQYLNRMAPRDLTAVCAKAMARNPEERYSTIEALASDLRAFLDTKVVSARRPGWPAKLCKWALRNSRYLALAILVLAIVAIAASLAYSFKIQSDAAQQINHLRSAQLAARQGQWRHVLNHLDAAEKAGYPNQIELALERIQAHTILMEHDRAREQLDKLQTLPDLGIYQPLVLLRLAEHQMFDNDNFATGLANARKALDLGLDRAEEAFVNGLLADSTPEALAFFHRTLELNPYHHGAHRHSLGLEFLLGRQEKLRSHLEIFKALYPEDLSPVLAEACLLALENKPAEAQQLLHSFAHQLDPQNLQTISAAVQLMGLAPRIMDVEAMLNPQNEDPIPINDLARNLLSLFLDRTSAEEFSPIANVRLPMLPSIKNGLQAGVHGFLQLAMPLFNSPETALHRIRAASRHHPESLIPIGAGLYLESHLPAQTNKLRGFLKVQAEFFQLGADLPSATPGAHFFARFMAALTQCQLAQLNPPDARARHQALQNIRWILANKNPGAHELTALYNMAFNLHDFDLARELLAKWEWLPPEPALAEYRIRLELATGAFGKALTLLDDKLSEDPENAWALAKRKEILEELRRLLQSANTQAPTLP